MKFPKCQIFWQSIASNYLEIVDLARLEVALDNHELRSSINLQEINLSSSKLIDDAGGTVQKSSVAWSDRMFHSNSTKERSLSSKRISYDSKPILITSDKLPEALEAMIFSNPLASTKCTIDQSNPYESLYHVSYDTLIVLNSPLMMAWCSKRSIRLCNVRLEHEPESFNPEPLSVSRDQHFYQLESYDLLMNVKRLEIWNNESSLQYNTIFPHLCSIQEFRCWHPLDTNHLNSFISTCRRNYNRPSNVPATLIASISSTDRRYCIIRPKNSPIGPESLRELYLFGSYLPSKGMESLILGLDTITKLSYADHSNALDGQFLHDYHLSLMADHWPLLSSLSLSYCKRITDAGLRFFYYSQAFTNSEGHRHQTFQSISLCECPRITAKGVFALIFRGRSIVPLRQFSQYNILSTDSNGFVYPLSGQQDTQATATHTPHQFPSNNPVPQSKRSLITTNVNNNLQTLQLINITNITESAMILSLLPNCNQLKKLEFMSAGISDAFISQVSTSIINLRTIMLSNGYENTITDQGMCQLVMSCQQLENIHVGFSPRLTSLSSYYIVTRLHSTIKDVSCTRNWKFISSLKIYIQEGIDLNVNYSHDPRLTRAMTLPWYFFYTLMLRLINSSILSSTLYQSENSSSSSKRIHCRYRVKINGQYSDISDLTSNSMLMNELLNGVIVIFGKEFAMTMLVASALIVFQLTALIAIAAVGSYCYDFFIIKILGAEANNLLDSFQ